MAAAASIICIVVLSCVVKTQRVDDVTTFNRRQDILEETADVAKRAVDRLTAKLETYRGTGKPVKHLALATS